MAAAKPASPKTTREVATKSDSKNTQSKLPFKVTKHITRKRYTKNYLQALERPTPPTKRFPVQMTNDGLVDINSIPDYLLEAVERNNIESPLLRLPKHIREKIWTYALYEGAIEIRLRQSDLDTPSASTFASVAEETTSGSKDTDSTPKCDANAVSTPQSALEKLQESDPITEMRLAYQGTLPTTSAKKKIQYATVSLPLTSRQVYIETTLLTYSLNTFIFPGNLPCPFGQPDGSDGALEGWAAERCRAQLRAITTIRPHWMDILSYGDNSNMSAFKHVYPGLKKVVCAKRAVGYLSDWAERGHIMSGVKRERARKEIMDRIALKEGEEVEVVF